jgi:hypothetical protein
MGTVVPGDDKELPALQAADMLAGQVRRERINQTRPMALQLWESQKVPVLGYNISRKDFDNFVGDFNVGLATDILAKIQAERERENESGTTTTAGNRKTAKATKKRKPK